MTNPSAQEILQLIYDKFLPKCRWWCFAHGYKQQQHTEIDDGKGKKGSCLVIAPLTILDSGAFTTSEVEIDWHWLLYRTSG